MIAGIVAGCVLAIALQSGASAADRAALLPEPDQAALFLEDASGQLRGMCEAGDSYSDHGPPLIEDGVKGFATPEDAVEQFIGDVRLATSVDNPQLASLDSRLRVRFVEYIEKYLAPARDLSAADLVALEDGHTFAKPIDEAIAKRFDKEQAVWSSIYIETIEHEAGGYSVGSAVFCSSQIFVEGAPDMVPRPGGLVAADDARIDAFDSISEEQLDRVEEAK